jgi:hypothetical protein
MKQDGSEAKFTEPELLEQAKEHPQAEVTVLVELDLPERHVEFEQRQIGGATVAFPKRVAAALPEEEERNAQIIEETRDFLNASVGEEPHWLQSARAFVVTATGSELLSLAGFPYIKAIHPNRSRQVGGAVIGKSCS